MTSIEEANGWYGGTLLGDQDESSEIYTHYSELCEVIGFRTQACCIYIQMSSYSLTCIHLATMICRLKFVLNLLFFSFIIFFSFYSCIIVRDAIY